MRQIVGTGILGAVAFTALIMGAERDAGACNTIPPENDCSVTRDGTYVYYARLLQTVQTSASPMQNCGCGQALGDLPGSASVVAAGVFDLGGNATSAFCGGGTNAQTTAAFQTALSGVTWSNAVLNAVSSSGVPGGQLAYGIWKVQTPTGAFDGVTGVAQVNFEPGGSVTVDPQHQAVASINASQCTDCSTNPFARACIATQTARPQLDFTLFAAKVACARTDAVALLGLTLDDEADGEQGGCSARAGGPASALLLGLVGVALAIGRARRRASS
jgi:MYXO-CTERM domain-containing protein